MSYISRFNQTIELTSAGLYCTGGKANVARQDTVLVNSVTLSEAADSNIVCQNTV